MKKMLFVWVLAFMLAVPSVGAADNNASADTQVQTNPAMRFTGKLWVETDPVAKEAYLYGLESAIEVEYVVNDKLVARAAKAGKKPQYTLSPFEKGWMAAFKDTTRKDIVSEIDRWYSSHPEQLDRPVLDVLWFDLIEPRLAAGK